MAIEHLVLILIVVVTGLGAGLYLVMQAERHRADREAMACSRCGEETLLVGDAVEHHKVGNLAIIERFQCAWCGHEQMRVLNGAEHLDGA
jgi:hypothetical protein